jgi:Leucine-rich repeat (LRR) protein
MSNNNRNSNTNGNNGNNNRNSVVILGKRYYINRTAIDLSEKKLAYLPESIGRLTDLEMLGLAKTNLRSLPKSFGQLKKLWKLDLDNNKLTSLPESIGKLTNLQELHLSYNKLRTLPESIGKLTDLRVLQLQYNKLRTLQESIGKLTNLKELDLGYNKLTSLPESIGNLTNLETLWLDDNKLTSLPESFKNLNRELHIKYNYKGYTRDEFIKLFIRRRVSKNTELINNAISPTNKLPPKNKRVYINTPTNVKPNGELLRLYNKNGINQYMNDRNVGRLHGGNFTMNNVSELTNRNIVNRNVYLRNIKVRFMNSSLNNFNTTVERIKTNLPSNISRTDVNNMVRNMKPQILQKIFNKLKNSPSNNRVRIMNTMKNRGFMNNSDIVVIKKKLLGLNFVRNSKKPPSTKITRTVNKMNHNNVRKSPYI